MSETPNTPGQQPSEEGRREEAPATPPPFSAAGAQRDTPPPAPRQDVPPPRGGDRPGAPPPIAPGPPPMQAGPRDPSQIPPRPGPPPYGAPPRPMGPPMGQGAYPPPGYSGPGAYGPTPPYGAGPMRPPFGAPDPRKVKRSRVPLIIGILVLLFVVGPALLVLVGSMAFAGSGRSGGFSFNLFGDRIAVLEVKGVIGQGTTFREGDTDRLRDIVLSWADDTRIRGMVLDINSPGGSVTPTWELFEAIQYFKDQGKPVYASMGETAASGGYLIAMAADEVYATQSTLTGSIGVIFSLMGYEELFNKLGLESRPIKSGEFKDIGSGTRPMTEAEKELLQDLIANIYDQFFDLVLEQRMEVVRERLATQQGVSLSQITDEMVVAEVRRLCDGRIFSGEQAFLAGMVDHVGYKEDAISDLKAKLGIAEETTEVMTPKLPTPGLFGLMSLTAEKLQTRASGMPSLEYRFAM